MNNMNNMNSMNMNNMPGNPQQMGGRQHHQTMMTHGYPQQLSQQGIPVSGPPQGNPQYLQGYPNKQMMPPQQGMLTNNMVLHGNIQPGNLPTNQNKQPTAILSNQNNLHKGAGNMSNQNKGQQPTMVLQKPTQILTNPNNASQSVMMTNQKVANENGSKDCETTTASTGNTVTSESSNNVIINEGETGINVANTKEKTPMCLLNELARYNKVSHQYMLVDEEGPAHQKLFYVKLKLGEEEYSASGQSIKKAQHAVASLSLEKTAFPKPPPKPERSSGRGSNSIMPTVELNAVAMRRGEVASYKAIEPRHSQYYHQPNFDFRGIYNQRYRYPRPTRTAYVSLKVGQREFIGEGPTHQAARHTAANKALRILKNLPTPTPPVKPEGDSEEKEDKVEPSVAPGDELKSEISLVHEIGLKRNMAVTFEVIKESGPPHMKVFITRCTVGDKVTEGEGNSKKLSKKKAAELMLDELKKLPNLPNSIVPTRNRPPSTKKKNRNLIKLIPQVQKGDQNYGVTINPISRLIQITQAEKKKEPIFTLVADHGVYHRREFIMQVQVDEEKCTGVGHNKKLAKRNAAEAMLHHLGFNQSPPQPSKSAIKTNEGNSSDKKVTFVESGGENGVNTTSSNNVKGGRQLVPGLLLIPDSSRTSQTHSQTPTIFGQGATQSEDLTNLGLGRSQPSQSNARPEIRLRELAAIHKFDVNFDDFAAQKNKNEFLCRLTIGLNPPQIFHGSGATLDASHDQAAVSALQILNKIGVGVDSSGDGPHVQPVGGANFNTPANQRKIPVSRVIKTDK